MTQRTEKTASTAAELARICDAQDFTVRFKVKNLVTGETIERGATEETPSASTRKISIMMAALKAIGEGRLSFEEKIVYEPRHAEQVASGVLRHMTPGMVLSLRDAIAGMITLSDNVCTHMVFERLTLEEVQAYCAAIGMTGTHHRFLIPPIALPHDHPLEAVTVTTAADQVMLLDTLLAAQTDADASAKLGISQDLSAFALTMLKSQVLRYGIHSRLPFDTVIASKGGRGKRGRMDAGIVYRDGAPLFILAAYTDGVPLTMPDGLPGYTVALETIGRLARACFTGL
ncbi:serine hydrolase [Martelella mediterranea]|uniref:beta-lactamase n=1 Tax=Martelella mediterranea DSM 17316 TaxID=1122214 RepID=A0A1U9Z409_9HYPH|nr:serine hydrolase [Martelella mediterranea]AQZ52342.1 beta-lactamase TEM [Martelella mediterranea DSM 17316]